MTTATGATENLITHLWVDMEYFPALSIAKDYYFEVKKYGVFSN